MKNLFGSGCIKSTLIFVLITVCAYSAPAGAETIEPHIVYGTSVSAGENRTTVTFEIDRNIDFALSVFDTPLRLVMDIPTTRFLMGDETVRPSGLFKQMTYGAVSDSRSRVVMEMTQPFKVTDADIVVKNEALGPQLVLQIEETDPAGFSASIATQSPDLSETTDEARGDRVADGASVRKNHFTVVIDAGHGGIDSGAVGTKGVLEKEITLQFAKTLADIANSQNGIGAKLTRQDDIFLSLKERVRLARQMNADLFISIHADSIRQKDFRGATVYTLSDTASDSLARQIARRENLSDVVGGLEAQPDDEAVTDILVDLTRRETSGFSISFADELIGKLEESVQLIKDPHRYAGFHVLRAPDVPSVLLELGYLSNPSDQALMEDADWQLSTARAVTDSIVEFARKTGAVQ